ELKNCRGNYFKINILNDGEFEYARSYQSFLKKNPNFKKLVNCSYCRFFLMVGKATEYFNAYEHANYCEYVIKLSVWRINQKNNLVILDEKN
ncbi:hypothetical protein BpHYR1_041346, partial [Brachionus plicatilis]